MSGRRGSVPGGRGGRTPRGRRVMTEITRGSFWVTGKGRNALAEGRLVTDPESRREPSDAHQLAGHGRLERLLPCAISCASGRGRSASAHHAAHYRRADGN